MSASIPGIKACHAIITYSCRQRTDVDPFDEAVHRLREEYDRALPLRGPDKDVNFHLMLTVDGKRTRDNEERFDKNTFRMKRPPWACGKCRELSVDQFKWIEARKHFECTCSKCGHVVNTGGG